MKTRSLVALAGTLLFTVPAFATCNLGLNCTSCVAWQQSYQLDPQSGGCAACTGLCKYYAAEDGSSAKAQFVPFSASDPNDIVVDPSMLQNLASTNPWAAYALYQARGMPNVNMRHGDFALGRMPTTETVMLLLNGAPSQNITASMEDLPAGTTARVKWDVVKTSAGDELVVRSWGGDASNPEQFAVFPAVALSVGDSTDAVNSLSEGPTRPGSWRTLE